MIENFLLEQFITVAESGSLSQAAEELHISQPALSRSMKKIESQFGIALFNRSKSRIAPNETGRFAVEYAKRALEANREMIERTVAFDRSRRTIALGACAFLPANELMPALHEYFSGWTISSEISQDSKLLQGLINRTYQMAILHTVPESPDIFYSKYMEEYLSVTFPADHILASKKSISFSDLSGLSILAHAGSGFWLDICRKNLKGAKLLVQNSIEDLDELVNASSLPVFNSNRAASLASHSAGRVTLPISDECAHITYYLCCLNSEKQKYKYIFKSIQ